MAAKATQVTIADAAPGQSFASTKIVTPTGNGWLHEIKYDGYRNSPLVSSASAEIFMGNRRAQSALRPPGPQTKEADMLSGLIRILLNWGLVHEYWKIDSGGPLSPLYTRIIGNETPEEALDRWLPQHVSDRQSAKARTKIKRVRTLGAPY